MASVMMGLIVLVGAGWFGEPSRDKTGPRGCNFEKASPQVPDKKWLAIAGSFQTEREGFSDR